MIWTSPDKGADGPAEQRHHHERHHDDTDLRTDAATHRRLRLIRLSHAADNPVAAAVADGFLLVADRLTGIETAIAKRVRM